MNYSKTIIGIDPGPKTSAVVQVLFTGEKSLLAAPLIIEYAEERPNESVCELLRDRSGEAVTVVCEWIACYGMTVGAEVFDTCRMVGHFERTLADSGITMELMKRQRVKLELCYSARVNDSGVRQALIDRFGQVGTKKQPGPLYGISGHLWSALAVAVAWEQKESARLKSIQRSTLSGDAPPLVRQAAGGTTLGPT